jgi:hypothetical protein
MAYSAGDELLYGIQSIDMTIVNLDRDDFTDL